MMFKTVRRAIAAALLGFSAAGVMYAQSSTQGGIAGTVVDSSSAAVSKATITIRNAGTDQKFQLTTDDSGFYKVPLLEPGTYVVTVSASGFGDFRADQVIVQVGQLTEFSPKLAAAGTAEVVQVTSDVPVLNFDSADFTSSLNQNAIENIPVNNRRWSALALTTPGVVSDSSGFGLVSVRGVTPIQNNVEIDGADDNDAYYGEERGRTREAYSTSENAVREFAVNSGVYSAEFGRAAGAAINSVTKSGTNSLHGALYFYDRESNWNAFQEHSLVTVANYAAGSTIPTSFTSQHFKPEDVRKIYGFTVSGPIIKDKLFYMYTYDQHSRIFPFQGVPSVPGTFFTLPAATTTGTCNAATGYLSGDTNTFNESACTLAARLNAAGIAPPSGTTSGSYAEGYAAYAQQLGSLLTDIGYTPRAGYQEINTPKVTWQVNSKNQVNLLFHRLRWDSPGGVQTASSLDYAEDTIGNDFVKLDYGVAKLSTVLSGSLSNEVLFQYGRELLDESQQHLTQYTMNNLTAPTGNVPEVDLFGNTTGFYMGSPYYSYRPAQPSERKWQVEDTLYWVKGRHTFKFGGDILHNDDYNNALNQNAPPAGGNGTSANGMYYYTYLGNYFSDLLTRNAATNTCDSKQSQYATATASAVGNYQCYASGGYGQAFGNPLFDITTLDWAVFVQDNWKVTPRLTLELGLRFDQQHLPAPPSYLSNTSVPQTASAPSNGGNNLGPRVGFSYDVYGSGKTLLRGGYGVYYGRILNGTLLNVLLATGSSSGQYLAYYSPTAAAAASPRFPYNITGAAASTAVPTVYYLSTTLKTPEVNEFDLQVQQDMGHGTVFQVSYLGGMSRRLINFLNTNLNPNTTTTVNMTFSDVNNLGPIPNGTVTPVKTYTSYTNPAYAGIIGVYSNINSTYNALVAELQNRSLKHLQFDINYTFSHALDYNQNQTTTTASNSWLDPYASQRSNYGNSSFNVPNRLVFYAMYELPGLVKSKNFVSYLTNDWSVDTSFQIQNGLPYSLAVSGTTSTSSITSGWEGTGFSSYMPLIGRNTYKYPTHWVDDMRVQKDIPLTEKYKLSLLLQVFNVANKQNIDGISTTGYSLSKGTATTGTATYSTSFGAVTTSNNSGFLYTPRELEIAAKFHF